MTSLVSPSVETNFVGVNSLESVVDDSSLEVTTGTPTNLEQSVDQADNDQADSDLENETDETELADMDEMELASGDINVDSIPDFPEPWRTLFHGAMSGCGFSQLVECATLVRQAADLMDLEVTDRRLRMSDAEFAAICENNTDSEVEPKSDDTESNDTEETETEFLPGRLYSPFSQQVLKQSLSRAMEAIDRGLISDISDFGVFARHVVALCDRFDGRNDFSETKQRFDQGVIGELENEQLTEFIAR